MTLLTCGLPFVVLGFVVAFANFFSNVQLYGGFFVVVLFSLPLTVPRKAVLRWLQPSVLRTKVHGSGLLPRRCVTVPHQALTPDTAPLAGCAALSALSSCPERAVCFQQLTEDSVSLQAELGEQELGASVPLLRMVCVCGGAVVPYSLVGVEIPDSTVWVRSFLVSKGPHLRLWVSTSFFWSVCFKIMSLNIFRNTLSIIFTFLKQNEGSLASVHPGATQSLATI